MMIIIIIIIKIIIIIIIINVYLAIPWYLTMIKRK